MCARQGGIELRKAGLRFPRDVHSTNALASARKRVFAVQQRPEGTLEFQDKETSPPRPLFQNTEPTPAPERAAEPEKLKPWITRLRSGDLSGPEVNPDHYLQLRDEQVVGNPRCSESYRQKCCDEVGLVPEPDFNRYGHFKGLDDFDLMR